MKTEPVKSTNPPSPPRWATRLLGWWGHPDTREEVQGDLIELYDYWVRTQGVGRANWRYSLNALKLLRPLAKRDTQYSKTNTFSPSMLRNYIKIALRNLTRNGAYTSINVTGLALGMTCGILIFTLVTHHLSFDNFHANSDRIYRFVTEQHRETTSYAPSVPSPLGKAFRNDYTFGEKVARIITADDILITIPDGKEIRKFKEVDGVAFAEPEYFDIFNFPLLQGNKATALTEPNTAILTERIARKYFGDSSPINKTFRLENKIDFRITGVLKDLPNNTDRRSEIFVSYVTLRQFNEWMASDDAWGGITSALQCFVRLRPGVSPERVEKVLPAYVKKFRPTSKNVHHYHLQPLLDIHVNAQYGGVMTTTNLWVLALIGLFLITTACVNFINLATAQALNRAKEVGVRKVLGSVRGQLFWQFIAETGLISVAAMGLALILSQAALPSVNDWFQSNMRINLLADRQLIVFILLLTLTVTFFAGSYPGLILARFQPVLALKGKLSQQSIGGFNTRRTLIVTQFAISQMLIIGVIIIASQMRFAQQSNLGFDKDAVVMVPIASESKIQTQHTLQDRLSKLAGVKNVSLCQAAPASDNNWNTSPRYDNRGEDENFAINVRAADDKYIPMFGLQLVAGRNLYAADTAREFVVNEMFARKLNLKSPSELLGKTMSLNGGSIKGPIVGVVKDFHNLSFHEEINAVCIVSAVDQYTKYAVKIDLANAKTTLAAIERTWSGTHPDQVFDYQFLDKQIATFYETEALMLKLIQAFAAIAIFIGCLGLYGLVSFMVAQKRREVGIRKVLGATTQSIVWLFGREFVRLTLIAIVIASPIAWYAMHQWLQGFVYKITIEWWVFALAGTLAIGIALLTVSFQSVKAALMNPVKSLKAE